MSGVDSEHYALSDRDILTLRPETNFWTYPEIGKMKHLEELWLNGHKEAVILYLTKEKYGHYCCIFMRDGIVSYFDPYGQEVDDALMGHIDPSVRTKLGEIEPYLFQLICESGYPAEYNDYRLEGVKSSTCGRHCIFRLWNSHLSPDEFAEELISEANHFNITPDAFVTAVTNESMPQYYTGDRSGAGIFDWIFKLRGGLPPKVRDYLKKYGDYKIERFNIWRDPIVPVLNKVLNALSLGDFEKKRKEYNIDKLFHLYMVLTLKNRDGKIVYLLVEKNEVINMEERKDWKNKEYLVSKDAQGTITGEYIPSLSITLSELFAEGEKIAGKDKFIKYNPISNNCQDFILYLTEAMFKLSNAKLPETLRNFIKQTNIEKLLPPNSFAGKFANGVTRVAGWIDRLIHGGQMVDEYHLIN